ncbi:MAG: DMT family transporter [Rubrivivax sp.]|jgi:drug/metabolite transporter (DMT)-like permease|nr:DMT family transporter [Rubrivivax sp.]
MSAALRWLPVAALMLNALTWGVSWWPLRQLEGAGLHPLWATVLIYTLAVALIAVLRPAAIAHLAKTPVLWVLVLAAGTTNATFNWAVTIGDVVRVVLLFYLMPLWAVLLARLLLNERLTPLALARVAMALAGAAVVLWPADGGFPVPQGLPDWLGLIGGFSFALNNVMLRREAHQPEAARALAMFFGGASVAGVLAVVLSAQGAVPLPPAPAFGWMAGALALAVVFLCGNLALQYGASRLPANVTAVVMLTEVLFASVSAVLLGAGTVTPTLAIGGGLILGAALLSARH